MRLDVFLVESNKAETRQRAKKLIEERRVKVNGSIAEKSSKEVNDADAVEVIPALHYEYVSRGGYKLEAALEHFGVDVSGLVAADLGASSGGFCDCLLIRNIGKIYAVDCGSGQLSSKIRNSEKVVSMENTNARELTEESFGEKVDIVVMDLSFISQTLVFPAISRILKNGGLLVSLIKPQFEAGRSGVGKNGIVKSEKVCKEAVEKVVVNAQLFGLHSRGVIESPVRGGDGNIEYLTVFDFGN